MLFPDDFNELLRDMGQRAEWRASFACPCGSTASGAPSKTCRNCGGTGQLWQPPVECLIGKTGSNVQKRWAQFGQYDDGDTVFTIGSDSPAYAIKAFDRVLMLDQTEPFSLKVTPGVNARMNFSILEVEKVLVLAADGSLQSWALPEVNQSGGLSWGSGAPPGTYSITGRRQVEFFAWTNQPFDRPHEGGQSLPRRIVMRRFDLFGRSS